MTSSQPTNLNHCSTSLQSDNHQAATAPKILVTNALPYANGAIHLGHMLGYIQADIWVRAKRLMGFDVVYVCADDAHGTAIMLKADQLGICATDYIKQVQADHERDFAAFGVAFDHYDSTDSDTNARLVTDIYTKNYVAGNITTRAVSQLFDVQKGLFLADRFIKGGCPRCYEPDQYGDACEKCGATYNATDLLNPKSTITGSKPILKDSEHYFFNLPNYTQFLQDWTNKAGRLPQSVINKLDEWFGAGLQEWDISRDAPYFGFLIPGTDNKYFYVWLDAPVGYLSSLANYLAKNRPELSLDDYFSPGSSSEIYHFIGKDIVYFHALFFPAMLTGAGLKTPSALFVNGFLTVNGQKMSKSRGTFITAATYLKYLPADALRYYFASKLSDKVEDSDLNLDDFATKVNADLVGKIVNIASRAAKFINTQFANQLADELTHPLIARLAAEKDAIFALYETRQTANAVRAIMALADLVNAYIDEQKPWAMIKAADRRADAHAVCSVALVLFYQLMGYLSPIVPNLAQKSLEFLQLDGYFAKPQTLNGHTIGQFVPLIARIDAKTISKMVDDSKEDLAQTGTTMNKTDSKTDGNTGTQTGIVDENGAFISIDDFAKVELKVAKVLDCQKVDGADKLLQFSLDLGESTPRNVFSGIAKFYAPEDLRGKTVICVANLAPRKMKFGVSAGMILSVEQNGGLTVVELSDNLQAGGQLL